MTLYKSPRPDNRAIGIDSSRINDEVAQLYMSGLSARKIAPLFSVQRTSIEKRIMYLKEVGKIPKDFVLRRGTAKKLNLLHGAPPALPDTPATQCFKHWKDLDREHPQGWGSLRITSDGPRRTEAYKYLSVSFVGSASDYGV